MTHSSPATASPPSPAMVVASAPSASSTALTTTKRRPTAHAHAHHPHEHMHPHAVYTPSHMHHVNSYPQHNDDYGHGYNNDADYQYHQFQSLPLHHPSYQDTTEYEYPQQQDPVHAQLHRQRHHQDQAHLHHMQRAAGNSAGGSATSPDNSATAVTATTKTTRPHTLFESSELADNENESSVSSESASLLSLTHQSSQRPRSADPQLVNAGSLNFLLALRPNSSNGNGTVGRVGGLVNGGVTSNGTTANTSTTINDNSNIKRPSSSSGEPYHHDDNKRIKGGADGVATAEDNCVEDDGILGEYDGDEHELVGGVGGRDEDEDDIGEEGRERVRGGNGDNGGGDNIINVRQGPPIQLQHHALSNNEQYSGYNDWTVHGGQSNVNYGDAYDMEEAAVVERFRDNNNNNLHSMVDEYQAESRCEESIIGASMGNNLARTTIPQIQTQLRDQRSRMNAPHGLQILPDLNAFETHIQDLVDKINIAVKKRIEAIRSFKADKEACSKIRKRKIDELLAAQAQLKKKREAAMERHGFVI